jgi:hypothetical protein
MHYYRHFKMIDFFFLIFSIFHALICIMCIKNLQNALHSTDVFLLWYFHLHLLTDNPAIFMVTFLLQEYSAIKCMELLHSIGIHKATLWSNSTHANTLYSYNRNVTLKMAGLLAKTCKWKYHNKNTWVELSACSWFLIHTEQNIYSQLNY